MIDVNEYLKEKYIAFVDVMGFSDMVNNFKFNKFYDPNFTLTDQDTFHVINEYYRKLLRELYEEQKSDLEITTISDCVIVSSKTLEPLLIFLFYLQSNMIYNDAANVKIIMRGYLTKGKFVHEQKKNLIVGEAYQRAVLGEKDTNFPRIEIDKIVVNEIKNPYDILVIEDFNDSKCYINYLIREIFQEMYCRIPLKNFIDKKIQEFEGNKKIQDKYIWLKNYYNNIKHYKLTNEDINKLKALNLSKD